MAAKARTAKEVPVPGPDTFDFNKYIAGQSTFPEFEHTVYLDQAAGIRLNQAVEDYEALAKRHEVATKKQKQMTESTSMSLVDDDYEALVVELDEIAEEKAELEATLKKLEDQVKESGLTLHFQVGTAQKLGKVVQQAEKEYVKRHGRGKENDAEYQTGRLRHVLVAQLAAYCTQITLPDGTERPPPDVAGFESLMDRLISSESVRLMMALNNAMDSSTAWAERVDAGFLGRGADLGSQPMGSAGPEDGASLVDSAADDSDRGEDAVV